MMFVHAIRRASIACAVMAACAPTLGSANEEAAMGVFDAHFAGPGRMSMTLASLDSEALRHARMAEPAEASGRMAMTMAQPSEMSADMAPPMAGPKGNGANEAPAAEAVPATVPAPATAPGPAPARASAPVPAPAPATAPKRVPPPALQDAVSEPVPPVRVVARALPQQELVVEPAMGGEARFDIAVKDAPAAQVFLQLGAGSRYNILVPPDLAGKITINLKSTTVPEALEALRELFGYDFRISGNRVFITSNAIQTRLFRINYLPGRRQGASEISISSATGSSSSGQNPGSAAGATAGAATPATNSGTSTSGSGTVMSSVKTTSDADFWRDVRESLESLIGKEGGRGVTINGAAGVIVVRATPIELKQVAEYLRAIQITIERQVMLEAKIIEVQLSRGSETGINWGLFKSDGSGKKQTGLIGMAPGVGLTSTLTDSNVSVTPGTGVVTAASGKGFYGLAVQAPNFAALLSFLESQGNVQVLSSPRIAALNNQKAVLKVGSDDTFVTQVTNNVTVVNNNTVNSPTVQTRTVFSGISLDVTPQIDDAGTVMLHVHPAISVATKKDMSLKLGDSGTYDVPGVAVSINETDSMVRVHDGQIVAIGGLMQQSGDSGSSGVPGLSEAPIIGGLFRYKSTNNTKRELVILIKPTIIAEDGTGADATVPDTPLLSSKAL